jgi:TM2 domain-containing membrane protein YozV
MDAARRQESSAWRPARVLELEQRSRRSYTTAVVLSSIFGFVGIQHFYLGRWGEGLLDVGLTIGWISALLTGHVLWLLLFLVADGGHVFVVTIMLLTGNYRDGDGLRVCYPGQRLAPRLIE